MNLSFSYVTIKQNRVYCSCATIYIIDIITWPAALPAGIGRRVSDYDLNTLTKNLNLLLVMLTKLYTKNLCCDKKSIHKATTDTLSFDELLR